MAFAIASLMAVASASIFGTGAGLDRAVPVSLPEYTADRSEKNKPTKTAWSELVVVPWPPPLPLPRTDAWTYELFGPPELRYDAGSRQFTVASSGGKPGRVDDSTRTGLELVAIRRRPFRLQLVGFFGEGADASGTFANLQTGETFLARAGRVLPELGLTITGFRVGPPPVAIPDSMSTLEPVATAEVRELSSGEVMILTDREWLLCDDLQADIRFRIAAGPTLQVAEGEEIQQGADHYRIRDIRLIPPEVDIVRLAADGTLAEQRTLVLIPTQSEANPDPVLPP